MIAAVTLGAAALLAGSVTAAPARPPVLSVAPAHLELAAGGSATVHVRGTGAHRLLLRASIAGLALDTRGRPRIVRARDAAAWLVVRPQSVTTGRTGATFVIASRRPLHARPGDHNAIVLMSATVPGRNSIAVEMRVGLVVTVRTGGRRVRRVEVVAARARRLRDARLRLISLTVANRGDVIESVGGAQLQVTLLRHGRPVARFQVARRKLLPRTRAVVSFRWRPPVGGPVVARVTVVLPGGGTVTRTFRLRL